VARLIETAAGIRNRRQNAQLTRGEPIAKLDEGNKRGIMVRRTIKALVAATALLSPAYAGSAATNAEIIDRFRFTLADGTNLTTANLRGRVVMVNFWATWCVPCRTELPLLNRYYRAHRAEGLVIIGVAADPGANDRDRWLSPTIGYPQAARVGGPDYRLVSIPMTYVIGRDGKLTYAKPGSFDQAKLDTVVGPLLKKR
jgi:cytochrome c biogenesis protein CcmG/thiol:disulfide interchange protein DsbE